MEGLEIFRNRSPRIQDEEEYFTSAVLLPLIEEGGTCSVLFEVRSDNLIRQPGEICFPGGKIEKAETGRPELTAVREAAEELGIRESQIELLGP
ncbi:MAG: NUDIX domain-containing protein, partial [Peptococcaceae bacterium]|nr:NUDIX domain-containing protein [Peptococcaceae bacterium]